MLLQAEAGELRRQGTGNLRSFLQFIHHGDEHLAALAGKAFCEAASLYRAKTQPL
jgi:hypothetical protein